MRRTLLMVLFPGWIQLLAADDLRPLNDYRAIMWISGNVWKIPEKAPLFFQRLREMGVNTGMIGDGDPTAFVTAGMPYYIENIVNKGLCLKFSSPVTDWSGFVNGWMKSRDEAALVRPYCLDDPEWIASAQERMRSSLRKHKANKPVLADIRDELSVTTSASPFDYDFSERSLAGFRDWLKIQYADLAALNKEWDTDFPSWDAVRPFTTDQIKARMATGDRMPKTPPDWSAVKQVRFDPLNAGKNLTKWNFSPWCDFRSYMDTVLARTLDGLRRAGHEADPGVPVGIEGTQMPHAFGGYDMWKLSRSVDWMEPYDVGCAREILGSFMAGAPFLATVFEKDTEHALRRLWHLLLLGDRGCIVWWSEDCVDLKSDDYALTPKARALAPALKEMTSPLARLFMRAEREHDPIAIHYSQASIQCAWLIESVADGQSWPRRFSSYESQHSRHAAVRNGWLKLLQDLGYSPRFVSTEQIENGELEKGGYRVLVMPDSLVLSDNEFAGLSRWLEAGSENKLAASNSAVGLFDGHGKRRGYWPAHRIAVAMMSGYSESDVRARYVSTVPDPDQFGGGRLATGGIAEGDIAAYVARRTTMAADDRFAAIGSKELARAVVAQVVAPAEACIRTHRFRLGKARLVAFERNVDYHMSEDLKQAGGNEALEKPMSFEARLTEKAHVYDLRRKVYLGETDRIPVDLDPWRPSLFALLPEKPGEGRDVVEVLSGTADGR